MTDRGSNPMQDVDKDEVDFSGFSEKAIGDLKETKLKSTVSDAVLSLAAYEFKNLEEAIVVCIRSYNTINQALNSKARDSEDVVKRYTGYFNSALAYLLRLGNVLNAVEYCFSKMGRGDAVQYFNAFVFIYEAILKNIRQVNREISAFPNVYKDDNNLMFEDYKVMLKSKVRILDSEPEMKAIKELIAKHFDVLTELAAISTLDKRSFPNVFGLLKPKEQVAQQDNDDVMSMLTT